MPYAAGAFCEHHVHRFAGRQHALKGIGFALVNGQAVLETHLDNAVSIPALIQFRQPVGGILVAFLVAG